MRYKGVTNNGEKITFSKKFKKIEKIFGWKTVDLIKMPHSAKILDEAIAFLEKIVYNVSNKSAVCGKNIRWRLVWRLKEMFI